jgi:serine/threonine-protein kinase HSL1 (negative regulator of Swe1 kinase)
MEKVGGGELFQYIAEEGRLEEKKAIFLFRQLVEALIYCHRMQIFHRDLKPENILLDRSTMTIKVIDFGMAAYQPTGEFLKTPCGSPHYAAPELLEGRAYDGSKADVWSLIVVLFVMLTNEPPFNYHPNVPDEARLRDLYEQIKACRVRLPSYLSKEAKDLFRKAFVRDPNQRIHITALWSHDLLHKYDKDFQYEGRLVEEWIGDAPVLKSWKVLTPNTIDAHIFRNLRTLWHDADEAELVEGLCSKK